MIVKNCSTIDFTMSGSLSSGEGELNAIVKEYLEHLKLGQTVQAFEEECWKLNKPIQDNAELRKDSRVLKIQNELLQYFDSGKRQEFFSAWETHVSAEVREGDLYCQKLELSLHVHFAVLPLRKKDHWVKDEADDAMLHFRYYLENKGSVLSQCADLLPYYALPYVPCPSNHPSFEDLFVDSWVLKLRNRLEAFLWEDLKGKAFTDRQPRLVELYNNNDINLRDLKDELKTTEKHLEESNKRCIMQAKKLEKLQEDCQQLMTVASLLVTALESAVKGDMVDMDCVLSRCAEHFPDTLKLRENSSVADLSASKVVKETAEEKNVECYAPEKSNEVYGYSTCDQLPLTRFVLNFIKIKKGLYSSDTRAKLLLLQALRWRLTKSRAAHQKEKVLLSYVENDLFGLLTDSEYELMKSPNEAVLQSHARFINSLASFSKGRAYLCQSTKLISALQDVLLVTQPKDLIIQDMTLGALQKLSMRKVSQSSMIEAGIIEWLINVMNTPENLTDYGLEYAAALLMNLCLCPYGKKKSEKVKEKLLPLLVSLLKVNHTEIIPYVNGTLYSILSVASIKQYAKEQGLEHTLVTISKNSLPDAQKQLQCVLKLFSSDKSSSNLRSHEDNEDEEEVDLEPELDIDDPVQPLPGELNGEDLLHSKYSMMQDSDSKSSVSDGIINDRKNNNSTNTLSKESIELSNEHLSKSHLTLGSSELASSVRSNSVPPQSSEMASAPLLNHQSVSEPVTPKLDIEATQMVRKIVGHPNTTLVEAANIPHPGSVNIKGLNVNEYTVAFSSRPKIPRTPEHCPSTPKKGQGDTCIGATDHMSPKIGASSPPPTGNRCNVYPQAMQAANK